MCIRDCILTAAAAKDIAGKLLAIFFPIWAFVVAGYEHCVANMYYIPAGMFTASNPDYVAKAQELYGFTAEQCASLSVGGLVHNLIPVTLGNIVGGSVCLGCMCFLIYRKKWSSK